MWIQEEVMLRAFKYQLLAYYINSSVVELVLLSRPCADSIFLSAFLSWMVCFIRIEDATRRRASRIRRDGLRHHLLACLAMRPSVS